MSLGKMKEAVMDLFSVICRGGGVMELNMALSNLNPRNGVLIKSLGAETFINKFPNIFKIQKTDQAAGGRGEVEVEAMMPLTFCPEEAGKNGCSKGRTCSKLHLCPYFIRGKCSFDQKCRCSHDIKDGHTRSLLNGLDLEDIDNETWLQLLKKIFADTHLERGASTHECPEMCKYYNNQGGCREADKCPFLHVCQHFVDGTCKFGDDCKRDHDLLQNKHNKDVFRKFRLGDASSQQVLYILRGRERKGTTSTVPDSSPSSCSVGNPQNVMRNDAPTFQQGVAAVSGNQHKFKQISQHKDKETSTPEKKSTVICGFHLRGQCNYGEKCMNQHRELPYQWQLRNKSISAPSWTDLPEDGNIMLERSYCNPSSNAVIFYHQGQSFKTDFDKMIAIVEQGHAGPPFDLRRLSTESSVQAPPGHIFSTRWFWYWEDERAEWQNYDAQDDGYEPNTTCSKSLEKDFLQGKESHPFSAGHHSYKLYYKKMFQKNDSYQTERAVRRRPEFVDRSSMKEIAQRRKEALASSKSRASSISEVIALPTHWNPMPNPLPDNTDFVRISLSVTSPEYKDIEKKFLETLVEPKTVKMIERIQNPDLWTAYIQKKERMSKKASNAPKEMLQLFHGTAGDVIDAICQQGFDWRMCGKHGTLFGKGTYFASRASYSHCYTEKDLAYHCHMFVARVLVGSYVVGDKSFTRPPPKDHTKPHGDLYDSCVNDSTNPSLFVVFDNSQSYPEYLITYKR